MNFANIFVNVRNTNPLSLNVWVFFGIVFGAKGVGFVWRWILNKLTINSSQCSWCVSVWCWIPFQYVCVLLLEANIIYAWWRYLIRLLRRSTATQLSTLNAYSYYDMPYGLFLANELNQLKSQLSCSHSHCRTNTTEYLTVSCKTIVIHGIFVLTLFGSMLLL